MTGGTYVCKASKQHCCTVVDRLVLKDFGRNIPAVLCPKAILHICKNWHYLCHYLCRHYETVWSFDDVKVPKFQDIVRQIFTFHTLICKHHLKYPKEMMIHIIFIEWTLPKQGFPFWDCQQIISSITMKKVKSGFTQTYLGNHLGQSIIIVGIPSGTSQKRVSITNLFTKKPDCIPFLLSHKVQKYPHILGTSRFSPHF